MIIIGIIYIFTNNSETTWLTKNVLFNFMADQQTAEKLSYQLISNVEGEIHLLPCTRIGAGKKRLL